MSSSANVAMEEKRASGCLASARRSARSASMGIVGLYRDGGVIGVWRTLASTACVLPVNGGRPVSR